MDSWTVLFSLCEPLKGILFAMLIVSLALIVPTGAAQAQSSCWDCATWYYPGDECHMDSCTTTDGAGESNCAQDGECGDMDTCDTNGHGCEGDFAVHLDGRSGGDFGSFGVRTYRFYASLQFPGNTAQLRVPETKYLRSPCNGAVIQATYSPAEASRLRRQTRRLTI